MFKKILTNGNKKKNDFLGIPHGTANGKLRKMIIFKLVQKTGEDICFHCGKKIESIDEFSIEHKKPWLDVSTALFWDLNNIAFSHLHCNCSARRSVPAEKEMVVDGKKWCCSCRTMIPVENFHNNSWADRGLSHTCKKCKQKYDERYRSRNR